MGAGAVKCDYLRLNLVPPGRPYHRGAEKRPAKRCDHGIQANSAAPLSVNFRQVPLSCRQSQP
jgi:hypothetical protein